jgi:hypothetical protein
MKLEINIVPFRKDNMIKVIKKQLEVKKNQEKMAKDQQM